MPYISDSGTPAPTGPDAFTPPAQFKAIVDAEADFNYYTTRATTGARDLIAAPQLREGLLCYVEADDVVYKWDGSAWTTLVEPTVACALRKSANQNLTTSAAALIWDVELSDPAGMHNNVTNNTRITAPVAGLYQVSAGVFNNNTSGFGTIQARLNGVTTITGSLQRRDAGAVAALPLLTTFPVVLAAGDYIEIMVLHSTAAGTIEGGTTAGAATVTVKRLGPV